MPERRPGPEKSSGPETVRRLPGDARNLSIDTPSSAENDIYDTDPQSKLPFSPSKSTMGNWFSRETVYEIKPGEILLDQYRVIQQLGEGGMGQVWLVEDIDLGQKRALKTISPKYAFDQEARLRLSNEAKAMARFQNHPNIPIVHEVSSNLRGTSGSQEFHPNQLSFPYIVMEFLPGESLEKLLEPGVPKPLDWTLEILTQVCEALEETHNHGIIHRDLKPSNLILTTGSKRRVLKMLDFGIAKMQGEEELPEDLKTMVGAFMGTPPYASPEQAYGCAESSSDIYSVGVILYELLTGFRPFAGRKKFAVIHATKFDPPPAFVEANPEVEVPLAVEEVVLPCLAKNPEDRPRTPLVLLKEFRVALGLPEIEPEVVNFLTPTPAPMVRRQSLASGSLSGPVVVVEEVPKPSRRPLVIGSSIAGTVVVGLMVCCVFLFTSNSNPIKQPVTETTVVVVKPETATPLVVVKSIYQPGLEWKDRQFTLWNDKVYLPKGYTPVEPIKLDKEGYPKQIQRDGITFVRILGGHFKLGIDKKDMKTDDVAWHISMSPCPVDLGSFYIQQYEVTNGEMEKYEQDPTKSPGEVGYGTAWRDHYRMLETQLEEAWKDQASAKAKLHPARQVPWELAQRFAESRGGRLPKEAEWEYAARSGKESRETVWGDKHGLTATSELANVEVGTRSIATSERGAFVRDATDDDIMDMTGNVREWCEDFWTETYHSTRPETGRKVVRGGSFNGGIVFGLITLRTDCKLDDPPPQDIGFRIVLDCPNLEAGRIRKTPIPD